MSSFFKISQYLRFFSTMKHIAAHFPKNIHVFATIAALVAVHTAINGELLQKWLCWQKCSYSVLSISVLTVMPLRHPSHRKVWTSSQTLFPVIFRIGVSRTGSASRFTCILRQKPGALAFAFLRNSPSKQISPSSHPVCSGSIPMSALNSFTMHALLASSSKRPHSSNNFVSSERTGSV